MSSEPRSRSRRAGQRWLSAYRPIFSAPGARGLITFSLIGRLSIGVLDIPLLLIVAHATRSYALAGLAVGLDGAGIAIGAPWRGRALDRRGSRATIPGLAILRATAIAALWPVADTGQAALILPLALLAGIVLPPMPASMRLQWKALLSGHPDQVTRAHAFETTAQVSVFVLGPALAAVGISSLGAGPTLAAAAVLLVLGAIPFGLRAVEDRSPPQAAAQRSRSPIRLPGVQTLVFATLCADAALGFVDVTVTAYARQHGHPSVSGLALAAFALAGVIGGALYGARTWSAPAARRLIVLTLYAAAAYLPLIVAPSLGWLTGLLVLAGAPVAAQWTTTYLVLDSLTPAGNVGEAMAWMAAANATGVGAGDTLAGVVIDAAGTRTAFAVAAGLLATAGVLLTLRRSSLTPSTTPSDRD